MFLMVSVLWSLVNITVSVPTAIWIYPERWYYITACVICYFICGLVQGLPLSYMSKGIGFTILFGGGSALAFWWINNEEACIPDNSTSFKISYIFCILWIQTGFFYIAVIKKMLFDYLFLISRHMT